MELIDFNAQSRGQIWHDLVDQLNQFLSHTDELSVSPQLDQKAIQAWARQPLESGLGLDQALQTVLEGMRRYTVHTPHPSYYGLFNPRANFPAILADTITATYNPQMAAWSHSPYAAEVETYLVQELGQAFGYHQCDGVFASGGAEANQTAVLCALNQAFPGYATSGLIGLKKRPIIYCSAEAHHSVLKAARSSGLGSDSVRIVNVDNFLKMSPDHLQRQIQEDIQAGHHPLMVVATLGTTGAGSLDPIGEIHQIVDNFGMWLHIDAAYGGALAWSSHQDHCQDLHLSDSITYDLHKWMSVPMGCSVFITRNTEILHQTFRVTTEYMPKEAQKMAVTDAFTHSIQWSRRFIGLKFYLSVLTFGWQGYRELIEHTLKMGRQLRELLAPQWTITNNTVLPIVCFVPKNSQLSVEEICAQVVDSGKAWISVYPVAGVPSLRACITNYQTQTEHLEQLVDLVNKIAEV